MTKLWMDDAWDSYVAWQTKDKKILVKMNTLIKSIERNGYDCIGNPEPLKGDLHGFWSVTINKKDRLVFRIEDGNLEIWDCGSHYGDK